MYILYILYILYNRTIKILFRSIRRNPFSTVCCCVENFTFDEVISFDRSILNTNQIALSRSKILADK